MSERDSAVPGRPRNHSVPGRIARAWGVLPAERRLAGLTSLAMIATLFLPWYQETVIARGARSGLSSYTASLTGWGAFSFVEAAVLLVSAAVLVLLFVRAEGGAFHVPGGDGGVVTVAGAWTCLLIVWRMFDKQGTTGHGLYTSTSGIEWGIFIALGVAGLLTYTGSRIKLANEPEPPLPGERAPRRSPGPDPTPAPRARRLSRSPAEDWSASEVLTRPLARPEALTQPLPPPEALAQPLPTPEALTQPLPPPETLTQPLAPGAETETQRLFDPEDETQPQPLLDPEHETRPQPLPESGADSADSHRHWRSRRPHRGLDFTELDEITFDEPPEPPEAPTVRRRAPDPARVKRPE